MFKRGFKVGVIVQLDQSAGNANANANARRHR